MIIISRRRLISFSLFYVKFSIVLILFNFPLVILLYIKVIIQNFSNKPQRRLLYYFYLSARLINRTSSILLRFKGDLFYNILNNATSIYYYSKDYFLSSFSSIIYLVVTFFILINSLINNLSTTSLQIYFIYFTSFILPSGTS